MAPLPLCYDVPERRTADGYLTPLPPDVYTAIFEYLQPNQDLNSEIRCRTIWRNCIPVCKYFRAHFIPLLFSSMVFETNSSGDDLTFQSTAALCSHIVKGQEDSLCFAKCVRHCTFVTRVFEDDNYETPYPPEYTRAVRRMPNITSLRLSNSIIDKTMIRTIVSLSKLTSLTLAREYGPGEGVLEHDLEPLVWLPHISSFRTSIVDNPIMENVLKRGICTWPLKSARIETTTLVNHFLAHGPRNRLEELYLSRISELDLLAPFLQELPTLRKLFIRQVSDTSKIGPEEERIVLDPGCLPNLTGLRCPADWALDLVPTRPIQQLELTTITRYDGQEHAKDLALWSSLRQATQPIKRVRFRLDTYQAHILMMEFPPGWFSDLLLIDVWRYLSDHPQKTLRYKSLRTPEERQSMEESLAILFNDLMGPASSLVIHLELNELIRDKDALDLVFQHHIIVSLLLPTFPNVHTVKISDWIEWRIDGQGAWWPHLYQRTAVTTGQTISSFLKRVRDQVETRVLRDWGGFFRGVLPRTHPRWEYLHARLDKLNATPPETDPCLTVPLPASPSLPPCDVPSLDAADELEDDEYQDPWAHWERHLSIPLPPSPPPELADDSAFSPTPTEVRPSEPRIERAREDRRSDADRYRRKELPSVDSFTSSIAEEAKPDVMSTQGASQPQVDKGKQKDDGGGCSELSPLLGLGCTVDSEQDDMDVSFQSIFGGGFGGKSAIPLPSSPEAMGPHDGSVWLHSNTESAVQPLESDASTPHVTSGSDTPHSSFPGPAQLAPEEIKEQPWLIGSLCSG